MIQGIAVLAAALILRFPLSAGAGDEEFFQSSGSIGQNEAQPAPRTVVKLLDGESGKTLDMAESGMFGKYKFEKVRPGLYVVQAGEFKHEVLVKDKNRRLDFDLGTRTGLKRGFGAQVADMLSESGSAGGVAAGPAPAPRPSGRELSRGNALPGSGG